jgi:hypothetical protein
MGEVVVSRYLVIGGKKHSPFVKDDVTAFADSKDEAEETALRLSVKCDWVKVVDLSRDPPGVVLSIVSAEMMKA